MDRLFALGADTKALLLMAATLFSTLPVAHYLYRFVELPGITFGKDILRYVAVPSGPKSAFERAVTSMTRKREMKAHPGCRA